jgi:hypothetical protein
VLSPKLEIARAANPESGELVHYFQPEVEMPPTNSTPKDFHLTHSHFQQLCGFCGCVFHVEITWRRTYSPIKAGLDTKIYSCPECQRDSRIKTSTTPKLTLLSKRTDGRTGAFTAQ